MTTLHEREHRTAIESGLLDEIGNLRRQRDEAFRLLREVQMLSAIDIPEKCGVEYELNRLDLLKVQSDLTELLKTR